jgi:hypothetical protein
MIVNTLNATWSENHSPKLVDSAGLIFMASLGTVEAGMNDLVKNDPAVIFRRRHSGKYF